MLAPISLSPLRIPTCIFVCLAAFGRMALKFEIMG